MNEDSTRSINAGLLRIFDLQALPRVTLEITVDNWNALLTAYDADPGTNSG